MQKALERIILFIERNRELISYLFYGALTTAVNFFFYFLCRDFFEIGYLAANGVSWCMAVIFAFITNRLFVFNVRGGTISKKLKEFFSFASFRLFSGGLETFILYVFVDIFFINDTFAKIIVSIITVVLNYLFSKFLLFSKNKREK